MSDFEKSEIFREGKTLVWLFQIENAGHTNTELVFRKSIRKTEALSILHFQMYIHLCSARNSQEGLDAQKCMIVNVINSNPFKRH